MIFKAELRSFPIRPLAAHIIDRMGLATRRFVEASRRFEWLWFLPIRSKTGSSMTAMRRIVPFAVQLLLCLFCVPAAFACSCAENNSVCSTYWDTQLLFRGRVTSIKFVPDEPQRQVMVNGKLETISSPGKLEVHFQVLEKFRGEPGSEIMILTNSQGSACGVEFQDDAEYLVVGSNTQGAWWTSSCTRTHQIVSAEQDPDLLWIRGVASAKAGGTIFGTVLQLSPDYENDGYQHQPLTGMTVRLKGPVERSATTDSNGEFRVVGLPAGKYEVTPEYPNGLGPPTSSTVSVHDKGCAEAPFFPQNDGVVDGHLLLDNLMPAGGAYMSLKRIAEPGSPDWSQGRYVETTGPDGHFHFGPVQPGAYVLGVNVDFPAAGSPYEHKNFYPGKTQQEQAEVIHIAGAQHVEGLRYVLPAERNEKNLSVKVKVVKANGAPAANASVELWNPQWPHFRWGPQTTSDKDGWDILELPEGEFYNLSAQADGEDGEYPCAGPVAVVAKPHMEPIVLVLTGSGGSCFDKHITEPAN
jgi:hypothetical protein